MALATPQRELALAGWATEHLCPITACLGAVHDETDSCDTCGYQRPETAR